LRSSLVPACAIIAERVDALLDDAVAKGARIVTGGKATSTLMPPTIVDGVKPGMRIYSEESFGPVVSVIRIDGVEEADEFTELRWITVQQTPRHYPI
jgi:acyl-CoA reductase-like NAD-dependent aldehyde dehydrogenase